MRFPTIRCFAGAAGMMTLVLASTAVAGAQGTSASAGSAAARTPRVAVQDDGRAAQAPAPNPAAVPPGPRFNVQDPEYNTRGTAGHGGCVTDASVSSGSRVVNSDSLAHAAYPPQVGWIAWVLRTNSGSGACHTGPGWKGVSSAVRIGATATTITQVNSATSITLSNSAEMNESDDVLFFGPDDYAPLSAACTAATNVSGGTVYAPGGIYLAGTNAGGNPWCLAGATVKRSFALIGDGQDATLFFTAPWYDHTFNFGSVFALYGGPFDYASGWTLDGGGFPSDYGPDTPFEPSGPGVDHVTVQNYDLKNGSAEVIYFAGKGGPAYHYYVNDSMFIGSGANITACAVSGPYTVEFDNTICSSPKAPLELTSNGGGATVTVMGGHYVMIGSNYRGGILLPQGGRPMESRITFIDSIICDEAGGNSAIVVNSATFVLHLVETKVNDREACGGRVSGSTTALQVIAGTAILENSTLAATGYGYAINNNGTVVDECGNVLSGGSGRNHPGVLQGSCGTGGILEQVGKGEQAVSQNAATVETTPHTVTSDGSGK